MKENKIEKLVLDLSNRWDCSPEEVVDRLNSMNESEINKLINSMTKKFAKGGMIDCLRNGGKPKDCGCGAKVRMGQDGLVAGEKKRRVDAVGDAWREKDGTAVLSRDAQGVRIQPGTDYVYENSTPPMRTEMRIKTDKGGRPKR